MSEKENIIRKAKETELLKKRINQNKSFQQLDFLKWIFDRIKIEPGSKIIELCSGTGSQTSYLLDKAGKGGQVTAVDISSESIGILKANTKEVDHSKLVTVVSNMDNLEPALRNQGFRPQFFDLAFCAYGLYYSKDVSNTLKVIKSWLKPKGRIVIIGPFGPNNSPLFNVLEQGGVRIPIFVKYTSGEFMVKEVIPWITDNYQATHIHTTVNQIIWNKVEDIIEYWENTTFYDSDKLPIVKKLIDDHLYKYQSFVNEKHIMMIEALHDGK